MKNKINKIKNYLWSYGELKEGAIMRFDGVDYKLIKIKSETGYGSTTTTSITTAYFSNGKKTLMKRAVSAWREHIVDMGELIYNPICFKDLRYNAGFDKINLSDKEKEIPIEKLDEEKINDLYYSIIGELTEAEELKKYLNK